MSGAEAYLVHLVLKEKEPKEVQGILVVEKFPKLFKLLGLPPLKEIEFSIELGLRTVPIHRVIPKSIMGGSHKLHTFIHPQNCFFLPSINTKHFNTLLSCLLHVSPNEIHLILLLFLNISPHFMKLQTSCTHTHSAP